MTSCYRPAMIINTRSVGNRMAWFSRTTSIATSTTLPLSIFSSSSAACSPRYFFSGGSGGSGDGSGAGGTSPSVVKSGHYQRPIFIAATRQHVGKTTVSLAMMSGLKKRFNKVGFIKPVGQQHVTVRSENQDGDLRVDKDVCLVKEHFHLDHLE
jgi:hypothetical protein